jgi:hypothetical protein
LYENNGALFINDKILEQVVINSKKDSKKFTLYFGANRSAGISKFFATSAKERDLWVRAI